MGTSVEGPIMIKCGGNIYIYIYIRKLDMGFYKNKFQTFSNETEVAGNFV